MTNLATQMNKRYYADGVRITRLYGEPVTIKWDYEWDSMEAVNRTRWYLNRLYDGSACFDYIRENKIFEK